ncbi:MAG: hypothetical protein AAB449_02020 [Patescibacteria group bacterium]
MKKSSAFARVFALGILVLLFGAGVAEANHSWNGYHWARAANPFTLTLGDNVTANWDAYLQTTSSDWSVSNVLDTAVVSGNASRNCKPTAGRAEICNRTYGNNGWLGVAQIWVKGSHITQGTVKVNDTYFNTPTYNTTAWKNLVMCQEVGHIFGLDHQDENFSNVNLGTCMDYTDNPESNQHPNAHDYEELEIIYAHLDTTTTVGQTTARGNSNKLDNQSEWGKEIHRSADGRASIFERDLGQENKVLTHVFWAEPRR